MTSGTMTSTHPPAESKAAEPLPHASAAGPRLGVRGLVEEVAVRALNYATNHIVARIPSFTLRHRWYQRVLGIEMGECAGIHLGCYVWFYSPGGVRRSGARIGENSRVNRDCTLDLRGGLTIGDNVSLSPDVTILTSAGMANSRRVGEAKPVVIEDNVWVGIRALIMPGVTVGRGAVVGAGAVVMSDVPPLAVVFGSPARPVGSRSPEEAEYNLRGPLPLFE
jgi:acetyltransferase-like isoleucine patch superfamily enzyme